jgi:arabinofuranosyltransferase
MPKRVQSVVLTSLLGAIALCLYAWQTERHYFLGDDSYISFRYALHLTEGLGLTWNPGEWVEGYTNFLWVLLMAGGLLIGIPPQYFSNCIGILSALVIMALLVRLSMKEHGKWNPYLFAAPLLLASSRTFTAWSTGGLATQFFALLLLAAMIAFAKERAAASGWPWASATLLIAATLTRPEGGVFTAVLGCFFLVDVLQRRRPAKHFLAWCAIWFAVIGAHFLWRYWAYGLWLPNTFYAKVNGAWLEQSANYFFIFNRDYAVVWYGWVIFIPLILRRNYLDRIFIATLLTHLSYLAYVGGDRFEFRFLDFILPQSYWLLCEGLFLAAAALPAIKRPLVLALSIVSIIAGVTVNGSLRSEARDRYHIASIHHMRAYANRRAKDGAFLRSLVNRGLLPADLRLCVGGAGALPYTSRLHTLDYYGLNDAKIAHKDIKKRKHIGHEHRATPAYMQEKQILMYDILGNIVYTKSDQPSTLLDRAKNRAKKMNGSILTARCRKVDDKYLIYASAVSDAEHNAAMAKLGKCRLGKKR